MSKFGIFWCFVAGVGFAAFVVGFPIASAGDGTGGAYIALGINVCWLSAAAGFGLLAARAARTEQRVLVGTEVRRTALAKIETSQASGEAPTFSIHMGLTIAPDGVPAFRADARAAVNLMDVDAYKVGRLLIVTYDETRPWRVKVVTSPTREWSQRAAVGAVDSAPLETRVKEPKEAVVERRHWSYDGTRWILVGIAAGVVFFVAIRHW